MTSKEIEKALKCCTSSKFECNDCPYFDDRIDCLPRLLSDCRDCIKRLISRIEINEEANKVCLDLNKKNDN